MAKQLRKRETVSSAEKLRLGFTWAEGDRYSQSECEKNPLATRLARCLEDSPFHHVPEEAKLLFRKRVDYLFERIPVAVHFVAEEPYNSCAEMQRDVWEKKVLRVRDRHGGVGLLAHGAAPKWRAVHDYYGHVLQDAPFSLSGELKADSKHRVQFARICWPGIYSNVVLENGFRLNRGHFLCYPHHPSCPAKVVFDTTEFGPEEEFYRDALLAL